jgi:hypothetical protein
LEAPLGPIEETRCQPRIILQRIVHNFIDELTEHDKNIIFDA